MYTGHMIEELIDLVARAEDHAQGAAAAPGIKLDEIPMPQFFYEPAQQPAIIGVA